jgi:cell division transport system permease protein
MRARFVLSEMALGLRRNLTMTIAVVLTVAISLAMLGTAWLIREQVNTMKGFWFGKIEVSVFLTKDVTPDQRDEINKTLHQLPEVKHVYYESQAQAYVRFKQQFKDVPNLVKNTDPSALPESFRVKLKDPRKFAIVASAVAGQPGVDEVADESAALKRFFRLLNSLQNSALGIAVVVLLAAVLLIFNTVRLAAFSRRRETGIMRLVGASNLYIQAPFILEGAAAGLVGGVLASGLIAAFKGLLIDNGLKPALPHLTSYIGWETVWVTVPPLILLGIVLAGITSMFTLQRYLRV